MAPNALSILLILENAGAGCGRHVIDLARGLLARGNNVSLIYSTSRLEPWFTAAVQDLSGLSSHIVSMVRAPSPGDLVALVRIGRLISRHGRPDVIHGHSSKGGALARLAGLFSASVYTPHAFYTLEPELGVASRWFYTNAERLLAVLSDGIICVSEAERRHALSIGLPARKLTVVQNGLAPLPAADRAASRRQLGLGDAHTCIGFVGRLAPQKAVGRLLTAFAEVAGRDPHVRLAIVGAGPEEGSLRQLAQRLLVADKVIWTGRADGPALMAGFDIFTLPSRYESFPYVLLEAAARGLPMVAARVGGVEEVVHDGINGYVVQDTEQLSSRLWQLSQDANLRQAMGSASLQLSELFTVDKMVDQTLEFYRSLVGKER